MLEIKSLEYLQPYLEGTNLEVLLNTANIEESNTLILVGSLVEGLATKHSDIDLILLGDRHGDESYQENKFDKKVQIHYWSDQKIDTLAAKMTDTIQCLRRGDISSLPFFNELELHFLHEMRVGIPLCNKNTAYKYKQQLWVHDLPQLACIKQLLLCVDIREDAVGQYDIDEGESGLWMLKLSVIVLCKAYLAALGETNPRTKWLITLLKRYKNKIKLDDFDRLNQLLLLGTEVEASIEMLDQINLDLDHLHRSIAEQVGAEQNNLTQFLLAQLPNHNFVDQEA